IPSGSTPRSSSAAATRSARADVFANRKPPVSVRRPTYKARALSAVSGHPRALARSKTSSAVAVASGATSRGPGGSEPGLMWWSMHTVGTARRRTACPRSPNRPRSPMSSTTITSAASISRTARSDASTSPSSGTRKSNRSGIPVGLAIVAATPLARSRCHSPISLPTPSPSALTWVVSTTRRPGVSTAATSAAARARSGGIETPLVGMAPKITGPGRLVRRASDPRHELRLPHPVGEVDDHPDREPDEQPLPGDGREGLHEVGGRERARRGHEPDPRRLEDARQVRLAHPQHEDTDRNDHEGEQSADGHQAGRVANRQDRGEESHDDAGDDGGEVGSLKLGVHLIDEGREQAVARHRVEHA